MIFTLPFPMIDPVLVHIGPFKIHWYGIAYVLGLLLGWHYARRLLSSFKTPLSAEAVDDSILWILGGIIIGGRLGHVIFYEPLRFLSAPWEIFMVWKGGMSFHGGLIGVLLAIFLFCRKKKLPYFALADIYATVAPIGLFLGRLANFVNAELYGRITTVSWGVIFPYAGPFPRHPSQLYEAFLEGFLLFIILFLCWTKTQLRLTAGRLSGVFLTGYGLSRIIAEFFREPEVFGLILGRITWGQVLSLPLVGVGWFLLRRPLLKP